MHDSAISLVVADAGRRTCVRPKLSNADEKKVFEEVLIQCRDAQIDQIRIRESEQKTRRRIRASSERT